MLQGEQGNSTKGRDPQNNKLILADQQTITPRGRRPAQQQYLLAPVKTKLGSLARQVQDKAYPREFRTVMRKRRQVPLKGAGRRGSQNRKKKGQDKSDAQPGPQIRLQTYDAVAGLHPKQLPAVMPLEPLILRSNRGNNVVVAEKA